MSADIAKINAAAAAVAHVSDGMVLGLGTGSTAAHFVRMLGQRVAQGLQVRGVPTSEATAALAHEVGVPLMDIDKVTTLDLVVDGADEIDPQFQLIKGGGAALLREKIVAAAGAHLLIIADESKRVAQLGAFPLPVEVTPFGYALTAAKIYRALRDAGCTGADVSLREGVVTDGGNVILDCQCRAIPDPADLADRLKAIVGVVEHGLFIDMARTVIFGRIDGVETLER
ncbi:MAG: ribose-5-phosphate isomerase RpiA [Hyphomonadaceae bacterium]|nr:ribose-5-phosphate isomerase RpiA [Hyphomonadaceae bacterium]